MALLRLESCGPKLSNKSPELKRCGTEVYPKKEKMKSFVIKKKKKRLIAKLMGWASNKCLSWVNINF